MRPEPSNAPTIEPPTSTPQGDDAAGPAPEPRREAMTALEVRALVRELQVLVGGFLDKAYQPARGEVLLRFRAPEVGRRDLFARVGKMLCFSEYAIDMPTHPPGFAMGVRKPPGGGRVYKVEQEGYDRVVSVWVQKKEGDLRVVFELFGDGNCILVRPDGRILVPLQQEAWAARTIRAGVPYQPPPPRDDPTFFDAATFVARAQQGNRDIVRALALEVGLGGPVAEEVCARVGVPKKQPAAETDAATMEALFTAWDALRREIMEGTAEAALLFDDGRPIDFTAHRSHVLEAEVAASGGRLTLRPMPSLSAALDALYLSGRKAKSVRADIQEVVARLGKLERQHAAQVEAVTRFEREITDKALEGDLLFAHYATVERIRDSLLAARREHDWKEIQARVAAGRDAGNPEALVIERIDPHAGRVFLRLADTEGNPRLVDMDITKTVRENAQDAYERSKTARDKLAGARAALAESERRMSAAAAEKSAGEVAVEDAMQRERHVVAANRHHWFEAFRWFYASTGELVVGGRDAGSNDRVVKKHLQEGDRYVHADIHGAPSVVVKAVDNKTPPTDAALHEAAQMAVTYSRAFGQSGSADAYWVSPPQVSKTPQPGEFLARGAFIVRGERNYQRKLPLEASVGLVWLDRDGRPVPAPEGDDDGGGARAKLMGGSPDGVHAHCKVFVDVQSGDVRRAEVIRTLARAFDAHPDAVDRALPTGDLRMVRAQGLRLEEKQS